MKRLLIFALLLVSGNALAQIASSAHDFPSNATYAATDTGGAEICAYCHTPHNSNTSASPIWNKATLTTTNYTAYGTTQAGTTIDNGGVPTGTTQLCLGCHDGTVAPGVVSNPPNSGWTENTTDITGDPLMNDTTFQNDHPVGFTYADSVAASADVIADPVSAGFPLEGGEMTCATCHDVHNEAGAETLLVTTNAASAMCQTCHTK